MIDENILNWSIKYRRYLHMFPEEGNFEFKTKEIIIDALKEIKVDYEEVLNTGIIVKFNINSKKTILLRADIDGLPINENNNISFKSKNDGYMHACGHDIHTAINLGLIRYYKENISSLDKNLIFIFQPAEETSGGAKRIIANLDLKNIDYSLCIHVSPELLINEVSTKDNAINANSTMFDIIIDSKETHGAYPHKGIDTIYISSLLIIEFQSIISRFINPTSKSLISIGSINSGDQRNIIGSKVFMKGIIRTICDNDEKLIIKYMNLIIEKFSKFYNIKIYFNVEQGYRSCINSTYLLNVLKESTTKINNSFIFKNEPSLGVDDFSEFQKISKLGALYYYIGTSNTINDKKIPAHNGNFNPNDICIKNGINLQILNIKKIKG